MSDAKLSPFFQPLKNLSMPHQQRGVALMMVLLLVVSITIVAGSMLASQKITTRKSGLLFEQNKLLQQVDAGEKLAVELIRADSQVNDFDSKQDVWAESIPAFKTLDGYNIELVINDASSRFNLNNLYHDGAVDEQALASFQRLLESLGLDSQLAIVILDWQDPDDAVYEDGGEESVVYANSDNHASKTVANQPFISVEQLADLPDVAAETIAILRPYVTAVPYWLPVNVNTADELVISSIVGEKNSPAVQRLVSERALQPIGSIDALQQLDLFANSSPNANMNNQNDEEIQNTGQQNQVDNENDGDPKGEQSKLTQAKKQALLDVQSRAFEALISISNDDKSNPKARFATVKIAKGKLAEVANTNTNNNTYINGNSNSQNSSNENPNKNVNEKNEHVDAFSRRLWAFRPPFLAQ